MPVGVCKMCLKSKPLVRSHLIARGFYRALRTHGSKQPRPIVITPDTSVLSERQVRDYLLCQRCDRRLATHGEDWVMQQGFNGVDFPLRDRLALALPVSSRALGHAKAYSGVAVGIDTEKIAYFALSLLWRGSIHAWRTSPIEDYTITLKAPAEPMREYLLGTTSFPANIWISATVCLDKYSLGLVRVPDDEANASDCTAYNMFVLGLFVRVFYGKVPIYIQDCCCFHSPLKPVYARDCSDLAGGIARSIIPGSRLRGSLKQRYDSFGFPNGG